MSVVNIFKNEIKTKENSVIYFNISINNHFSLFDIIRSNALIYFKIIFKVFYTSTYSTSNLLWEHLRNLEININISIRTLVMPDVLTIYGGCDSLNIKILIV